MGICLIVYVITRFLESEDAKEAGIKLAQCPYKIESPELTLIPRPFENGGQIRLE